MGITLIIWPPSLNDTPEIDHDAKAKQDFSFEKILFSYNDHNTKNYEGDSGLRGAYCINGVDGYIYWFGQDDVRGLAYASNGTFNFTEHIYVNRTDWTGAKDNNYTNYSYDYIVMKMYYKTGDIIPSLSISDSDLTTEQKKYFDDYEQQKNDYYHEQEKEDLDYMADSNDRLIQQRDSHKYSYYYGLGGRGGHTGVIYTP